MPDIQTLSPKDLKSWPRNARTHSTKQVRQLAKSIRRFGFTHPVLIDEHKRILAGHGRVQAALALGLAGIPCIAIEHLSEAEKRAYVIADNKLALNSGWDRKLLAEEMKGLLAEDVTFDIGAIGFSIAEKNRMFKREDAGKKHPPTAPPPPARCHPGDIWRLGPHRLICAGQVNAAIPEAWWDDNVPLMIITVPEKEVHEAGNATAERKWSEAVLIIAETAGQHVIFGESDPAQCDRIIQGWEDRAQAKAALISGDAEEGPQQPKASP